MKVTRKLFCSNSCV